MPYVMESDRDDTYLGVSGFGDVYVQRAGKFYRIPEGSTLALVPKGTVTFVQASAFQLMGNAYIDRATGKLEQTAVGRLAQRSVIRSSRGLETLDDTAERDYFLTVPKGFQVESPGGATPQVQPPETPTVPPAAPAVTVAPPRSAKEIVKVVQARVGAGVDGAYGSNTNSKLKSWAGTKGVSATVFNADGPRALTAHVAGLGLTSTAELEVLGVIWDTWQRTRSTSSRTSTPAVPVAPLAPEVQAQLTPEDLLRQGAVQKAGFADWIGDNWWILAAVAVVGVGGYIVWKRRQDLERPALPASEEV
jgi:hypothetical protein